MNKLFPLLAVVLFTLPARAENVTAQTPADKAAAYMDARLKVSKFSGTVLIAKDGQTLFAKGYGFANVEHEVPNTPKTKFRLASVSKQFVATGIMLLEHDGKLKVEDPLKKHLPDSPKAWADVTLHQLMSHTSGVPENLRPALFKGMWPQPTDLEHILDVIKEKPLDFKSGEKYSYSNTGYVLLGLVIEKLSGRPYGDFLRDRIFKPLGMTDTGVDRRNLVLKHRANNYGLSKGDFVHAQYIDLSQVYAAGSLYSTVEDLLKWDTALYTDKILPQKSLEKMWTAVKDNYGYGWLIRKRDDRKQILHTGGLPGCQTIVCRYPEQHVFVAVLCNVEGSPHVHVSYDLGAIALGDPYDLPAERKEAKIDPKILDAYVGEYDFKPKVVMTISKRDDGLYAQASGQGRFQILPESETKFFSKSDELTIAFAKDEKGTVTELVFHQNGRDVKAKRLPPKPPEKKDEKKEDKKDK
jgi:CubicO group peptidase (beta-lactamase class C family)